ncbi:MAG TPA: hypothetical protein VMV72_12280 [Verrucomicrobiae bacterium]|nr:hypothetical protein [Verrucomicrobiae bacterium]
MAKGPHNQPDQAQAEQDFENRRAHRQSPSRDASAAKRLLPDKKLGGRPGKVASEQRRNDEDAPHIHTKQEQSRERTGEHPQDGQISLAGETAYVVNRHINLSTLRLGRIRVKAHLGQPS